jgi:SAM-dependent methyltransferase
MLNQLHTVAIDSDYLNGKSFADFYQIAAASFPDLCTLLDQGRTAEDPMREYTQMMNSLSWEFEDVADGGRGAAYNVAQQATGNRQTGMLALLSFFSPSYRDMPDASVRILDVLGGDGTLARFVNSLQGSRPTIYTADLSRYMVEACLRQGLPCIRQGATQSLFQDNVLDGVLIAYGSHHLTFADRLLAASEAYRTLKPGGRLVLHDFETGSRTAQWFEEVVHPYSRTGHPHPHFSRQEMWETFEKVGFRDIRILELNDPFTLVGDSAEDAIEQAAMHMYHMYDLVKIANDQADIFPRVKKSIEETLGPIEVSERGEEFLATIPRKSLVAIGTKS